MFGAVFVVAILASAALWNADWAVARTDALFVFGVLGLVAMFALGWNALGDALPIGAVFLAGVVLEWQRTGAGAWAYEAGGVLQFGQKPLFVGFMYAAVGSYIIRSLRLKALMVTGMPAIWIGLGAGAVIYGSYFLSLPSWVRPLLLTFVVIVFSGARVRSPSGSWLYVPVALAMAAVLLWVAENVGTFTGTWSYPGQGAYEFVSLSKIGAWFLLLNVCFLLVIYLGPGDLRRHREGTDASSP